MDDEEKQTKENECEKIGLKDSERWFPMNMESFLKRI